MRKGIIIICLLTWSFLAPGKQTKHGVDIPENYQAAIDVVYKSVKGWDGRLDVYFDPLNERPTPLVINIHGGGWNHGEKESQKGFKSFFKNGFTVVNVEYRLVDVAPAPAAIQDVKCALMYMVTNAGKYNIDVNKIVLMGGSAGGHLALMAGLSQGIDFLEDCESSEKVKIAAIIDKYGVTDLSEYPKGEWNNKSVGNWLGVQKNSIKFAKSVSPLYYVDNDSPPIFIVHGDSDPIVPYNQSAQLHQKLMVAGVRSKFLTIKGGNHGKFTLEEKSNMSDAIFKFLKELKIIA